MRTLPMSIHVKFRLNLIAGCLDMVNKSLTKKCPGEERKKERIKRNSLTDVDTLRRQLRYEEAI